MVELEDGILVYDIEDCSINNCFATLSGRHGIGLVGSKNINFNDCLVTLCDSEGIYLGESGASGAPVDNINFTNVIVKNSRSGISIHDGSDITFTSCQSYDDREPPLQDFGLELYGTNTGISLLYCILSPNEFGEIWPEDSPVYIYP